MKNHWKGMSFPLIVNNIIQHVFVKLELLLRSLFPTDGATPFNDSSWMDHISGTDSIHLKYINDLQYVTHCNFFFLNGFTY